MSNENVKCQLENIAHNTKMINLVLLLYNVLRWEKLWLQNDAWSHEAKGINVVETKIGTILVEINSEAQTKGRMRKWECLELFMGLLKMDFPAKQLGMPQWPEKTSIQVNDYIFHLQGQCISDFSNILKFTIFFSEIVFGAI